MNAHRAAAEALFAGPVERIERRTRRVTPLHDQAPEGFEGFNRITVAARLRELEKMAAELTIWRNAPDRFFEDRSELKAGLSALARQLEGR